MTDPPFKLSRTSIEDRIVRKVKGQQMSSQAQKSSANALQLPTTSTPASHKRSAGSSRQASRPSKKRRVMQTIELGDAESGYDSDRSKRKDDTKPTKGIAALISGLYSLFKLDFTPPSSSTSSTSKPASKGNLRDIPHNQSAYEGVSDTVDLTIEPEDDTFFLSPPTLPQSLPSSSSQTMNASSGSWRRTPMYREEVSLQKLFLRHVHS